VIEELDLEDEREALRVLEVQRDSYAVEARLIGSRDIPALGDTVASLRGCGETFLGYREGGRLAGVISYKKEAGVLDVHRLAVHPEHFRQGIARSLLRYAQAHTAPWKRAVVSTGAKNTPARTLYQNEGFQEAGEDEVAPGLRVVRFEKAAPESGLRPSF
jgi:ribosomal protein S18 acetylase RimI-like enzyme